MSSAFVARPFEPTDATQTDTVTATAKTITLTRAVSDVAGTVRIANIGTNTIFIRLDGVTPTNANAIAMIANSVEVFSVPTGKLTVKYIADATGNSIYVTPGRGA